MGLGMPTRTVATIGQEGAGPASTIMRFHQTERRRGEPMTTGYIALLRGINVAGHARIAMPRLRQVFESQGHEGVTTYLQSGNVMFSSSQTNATALAGELAERITADLGVTVRVLLRTPGELAAVVDNNVFLRRADDVTKLHVTFLAEAPSAQHAERLTRPEGESADFAVVGREVYLHCPDGYGRTKLNNAFLERRLGVAATTRNWKTVTKLHELAG
jgi:uncharacterized protein (DUF1697 family)